MNYYNVAFQIHIWFHASLLLSRALNARDGNYGWDGPPSLSLSLSAVVLSQAAQYVRKIFLERYQTLLRQKIEMSREAEG